MCEPLSAVFDGRTLMFGFHSVKSPFIVTLVLLICTTSIARLLSGEWMDPMSYLRMTVVFFAVVLILLGIIGRRI